MTDLESKCQRLLELLEAQKVMIEKAILICEELQKVLREPR
jgi:hypothetical protein